MQQAATRGRYQEADHETLQRGDMRGTLRKPWPILAAVPAARDWSLRRRASLTPMIIAAVAVQPKTLAPALLARGRLSLR
jgi:hypothetical protein